MIAKRGLIIIESVLLMIILVVFTLSMSDFEIGCKNIYDNMLRLHVIANSDSQKDQELKLKVRDEILNTGKLLFDGSVTKETAKEKLESEKNELIKAAKDILVENGCECDVSISFAKTYFNTRAYDSITVPAGFYDSVLVEIGKAEGSNWWCVMFPPLCLPAVTQADTEIFSTSGNKVLNSDLKIDVRFKVVEVYQSAKKLIKNFRE